MLFFDQFLKSVKKKIKRREQNEKKIWVEDSEKEEVTQFIEDLKKMVKLRCSSKELKYVVGLSKSGKSGEVGIYLLEDDSLDCNPKRKISK